MKAALLSLLLVVSLSTQAAAEPDPDFTGSSGGGGLGVSGILKDNPPPPPPRKTRDAASTSGVSLRTSPENCPGAYAVTADPNPVYACPAHEIFATDAQITVGLIRTAFAELKLPAGKLVIQPPDGLTLVNFDTNFYTTSTQPISRTVTLLGQSVTLEATPATFTWTFGDGQSMATDIPGRPYPKLDITHNYLRTGTYLPSLSTTYTGRFRVGNGPWRQIPGTVTIDGTGQSLRAIEAQPKLVGY